MPSVSNMSNDTNKISEKAQNSNKMAKSVSSNSHKLLLKCQAEISNRYKNFLLIDDYLQSEANRSELKARLYLKTGMYFKIIISKEYGRSNVAISDDASGMERSSSSSSLMDRATSISIRRQNKNVPGETELEAMLNEECSSEQCGRDERRLKDPSKEYDNLPQDINDMCERYMQLLNDAANRESTEKVMDFVSLAYQHWKKMIFPVMRHDPSMQPIISTDDRPGNDRVNNRDQDKKKQLSGNTQQDLSTTTNKLNDTSTNNRKGDSRVPSNEGRVACTTPVGVSTSKPQTFNKFLGPLPCDRGTSNPQPKNSSAGNSKNVTPRFHPQSNRSNPHTGMPSNNAGINDSTSGNDVKNTVNNNVNVNNGMMNSNGMMSNNVNVNNVMISSNGMMSSNGVMRGSNLNSMNSNVVSIGGNTMNSNVVSIARTSGSNTMSNMIAGSNAMSNMNSMKNNMNPNEASNSASNNLNLTQEYDQGQGYQSQGFQSQLSSCSTNIPQTSCLTNIPQDSCLTNSIPNQYSGNGFCNSGNGFCTSARGSGNGFMSSSGSNFVNSSGSGFVNSPGFAISSSNNGFVNSSGNGFNGSSGNVFVNSTCLGSVHGISSNSITNNSNSAHGFSKSSMHCGNEPPFSHYVGPIDFAERNCVNQQMSPFPMAQSNQQHPSQSGQVQQNNIQGFSNCGQVCVSASSTQACSNSRQQNLYSNTNHNANYSVPGYAINNGEMVNTAMGNSIGNSMTTVMQNSGHAVSSSYNNSNMNIVNNTNMVNSNNMVSNSNMVNSNMVNNSTQNYQVPMNNPNCSANMMVNNSTQNYSVNAVGVTYSTDMNNSMNGVMNSNNGMMNMNFASSMNSSSSYNASNNQNENGYNNNSTQVNNSHGYNNGNPSGYENSQAMYRDNNNGHLARTDVHVDIHADRGQTTTGIIVNPTNVNPPIAHSSNGKNVVTGNSQTCNHASVNSQEAGNVNATNNTFGGNVNSMSVNYSVASNSYSSNTSGNNLDRGNIAHGNSSTSHCTSSFPSNNIVSYPSTSYPSTGHMDRPRIYPGDIGAESKINIPRMVPLRDPQSNKEFKDEVRKLIGMNLLFRRIHDGMTKEGQSEFVNSFKYHCFQRHEAVFKQGEEGENFYLIMHGDAEVWAHEPNWLKFGDHVRNTRIVHFGGRQVPIGTSAIIDKYDAQREYPYTIRIISTGQRGRILATEVEATERKPQYEFIAPLHRGDYFGETALLENKLRCASVHAGHDGLAVISLNKEKFKYFRLEDKLQFVRRKAMVAAYHIEQQEENNRIEKASKMKTAEQNEKIKRGILNNANLKEFVGLSEEAAENLARKAYCQTVKLNEKLIIEGDLFAEKFYVVERGTFSFQKQQVEIGQCTAGGSFGELALMYHVPRACTVILTSCNNSPNHKTSMVESMAEDAGAAGCGKSESKDDQNLGKVWVISRTVFKRELMGRAYDKVNELFEFVSQVDIFTNLLADEKKKIAESLIELRYNKGDVIAREGEKGDLFYLLKQGSLLVSQTRNALSDSQTQLHHFNPARIHWFGERSLLKNEPRKATVCAHSDQVVLLALPKAQFDALLFPVFDLMSDVGFCDRKKALHIPKMRDDGVTLGDLTRVGLLGCGGFGAVSLEQHRATGKTFALKSLSKGYIIKMKMQSGVIREKQILGLCNSQFIIRLHNTFKTEEMLYFLLEPALGGELFAIYHKYKFHGSVTKAKFYSASVVFAFEHLHERSVLYRDLKPENLLLDARGFCKLTDMGLAKVVNGKTFTTCGTPDYFAPEVVRQSGMTRAVDWWTLGVLIHELLSGHAPFESEDQMETYKRIVRGTEKVNFGPYKERDPEGVDFVKQLLREQPNDRLPMKGLRNLRLHPWYKNSIDWESLYSFAVRPPHLPSVKGPTDLSNFRAQETDLPPNLPYRPKPGDDWDRDF